MAGGGTRKFVGSRRSPSYCIMPANSVCAQETQVLATVETQVLATGDALDALCAHVTAQLPA